METVVAIKLNETTIKQEILDIGGVHDEVEPVVPIKLEEGATIKREILDITEIYNDLSPIEEEYYLGDNKGFRDMGTSRRTLSVANSAVFVCHHCGCEGKSLEDMRRHMRRHRGLSVGDKVSRVEEVKRDTSMCRGQGEASRPKDVKRGHNGEKPFACDQCDYRAYKLSYMTKHIRIHTGEKPFLCDQCDYRASQLSHLKVHKRTHSGVKPFSCDQCDYTASRSTNLARHKRIHTGEKPFLCDQCDYRASQSSHLKVHKRTHSGVKQFSCDQCDYTASRLGTLTRHKRIHTGTTRWPPPPAEEFSEFCGTMKTNVFMAAFGHKRRIESPSPPQPQVEGVRMRRGEGPVAATPSRPRLTGDARGPRRRAGRGETDRIREVSRSRGTHAAARRAFLEVVRLPRGPCLHHPGLNSAEGGIGGWESLPSPNDPDTDGTFFGGRLRPATSATPGPQEDPDVTISRRREKQPLRYKSTVKHLRGKVMSEAVIIAECKPCIKVKYESHPEETHQEVGKTGQTVDMMICT
ncbi:hypothetical protein AAG570_007428 [Ranatra chinensis]|uniref:C2H2-type domain-containing protein n=1 Tax=Ranatra chinensis TaxID=642074 RepID=A0ABD0Y8V1_9HEMI